MDIIDEGKIMVMQRRRKYHMLFDVKKAKKKSSWL